MVDRNQQKVAAFASRRKLQELEQAAAQGRVVVVDAIGRGLRAGDMVAITGLPIATVFRLVRAEPILADPRMAGMIDATFAAEFTIPLPSGHPTPMLLIDPIDAQIEAARAAGEITDAQATEAAAPAAPPISPIVLTDAQH